MIWLRFKIYLPLDLVFDLTLQIAQVTIPHKNIVDKMRESQEFGQLMTEVNYRVGWEIEQERLAYSQIDWHDFVVVQTVDFQPSMTRTFLGV
jgi:hypothetical protein